VKNIFKYLFGKELWVAGMSFSNKVLLSLGMGKIFIFWEDAQLGESPLSSQYPALYNIMRHKHVRVADVLSNAPLNIGFRRVLRDGAWESWLNLVQRVMTSQLNDEPDHFIWHLTTPGVFSVKPFYANFVNDHTKYVQKYLWKMKVPLKIGIFMWFLHRKVILTKDNLLKRSWSGCTKCAFCNSEETVETSIYTVSVC
jgi:hypothetical protein